MLLTNSESSVRPSRVALDRRDGKTTVRLTGDVREVEREDGTVYVYDEVFFTLGSDREDTLEDIEAAFDGWWEYGSQPDEPAPTLEDRVEMLEELLFGGEM